MFGVRSPLTGHNSEVGRMLVLSQRKFFPQLTDDRNENSVLCY